MMQCGGRVDANANVYDPQLQPQQLYNHRFRVAKVDPAAVVPRRATTQAAGFDLASVESATIPPMSRKLISTGLIVSVPEGTYGRIAPRSGISLRSGICVGAGVIDADYTGVVKVLLFNHDASAPFEVRQGDRIAQLVLEKIVTGGEEAELVPVESITGDVDNGRGAGGFGSTGV
jgi:dUTP pyrophosphatase